MSFATTPRPRIEIEPATSPRLEPFVPLPRSRSAPGSLTLMLGGLAVLVVGFALLQIANFVADQFARGPLLGTLTLAIALGGLGLLGLAVWREIAGLFAIAAVDGLRADFASGDAERMRMAARSWLGRLPEGDQYAMIGASAEPAALLGLLRAGPVAMLRSQADALGREAAVQIFAATAAIPSPALDGLLVAWRGIRLVRQVAVLHGLRPGLLGTFALLRRALLSAAGTAAANLAVDTLARAVLSNPLLQHLAGDVAGASVAARRTLVLARVAAAACSPVPDA